MKITDVRCVPVFDGSRNFLFVVVDTDEGLHGVGEFGITWKERAGMGALEHMKQHLLGEDPLNIERLWQVLLRGDFFPGGRINMAAISAIDIALWDIKGKALGQPVHMLLGGQLRDRVFCYTGITGATPEQMAASARRLVEEGWRYLRMQVPDRDGVLESGDAVREALANFAAAREAVGPDIELCLDVHTRLDPPDTIRLGRKLEGLDPYFLEDPLRCENPASYRHVRDHVSVPLAIGEHFASKWEFRHLIEEELVDYARIDVCIVGGLTEARKIANWAETHYIKIAPHNPLGPASAASCLHLDLACDNASVQEIWRLDSPVWQDLFPLQVPFEKGCMLPPERPGLGIEFDEAAAAQHPPRWGQAPRLRRADGSFTNW